MWIAFENITEAVTIIDHVSFLSLRVYLVILIILSAIFI